MVTNQPDVGMLEFEFEGTAITDEADQTTTAAALEITLKRETCDWLTEPVVTWFRDTVRRAVMAEFDRYIEAGDLAKAKERMQKLQAEMEKSGGHVGMYL